MAQAQRKLPKSAKGRRSSRHRAKRLARRYRVFANIQRKRARHRARHPLDKQIENAKRWLTSQ